MTIIRTNRGYSEERPLDPDDPVDEEFLKQNTVDPDKVTRVVQSKSDDNPTWRKPTNPIFVIKA